MILQQKTKKIALLDAAAFLKKNKTLFVVKEVHEQVGKGKYDTILKIVRGKRGKRMNPFARKVLKCAIDQVLLTAKDKQYLTTTLQEEGESLLNGLRD